MFGLRVHLLGPPRIEVDGDPLEVDTRKAVALLAYLAVTATEHARDSLAALLWPDYTQERARGALRRTLSVLRKGLGGGRLIVDRNRVGLETGDVYVDLLAARASIDEARSHDHGSHVLCGRCAHLLEKAVELQRGEFMEGFALRDSPEFDDWQYREADRTRRDLAAALELLVASWGAGGRFDAAIDAAERWLSLDPLQEAAHRALMRLYSWRGDRSEALNRYRTCVAVLDQELGVAPLEDTTALYEAIAEDRLSPPEPPPPGPPQPSSGQTIPPAIPLVGRERELELLRSAYRQVGPDGHLVSLEGEAGIGKTRLAEGFIDELRAGGASVVGTRCYEDEMHLAYAPIADALRTTIEGSGGWPGSVPRRALAEAARLVPEIAEAVEDLPAVPPLDSPGARAAFVGGLAEVLFSVCAGDPAGVVFVDDAHGADDASLDVLTYMAHRLRRRPLMLVMTWRAEQLPPAHRLRRISHELHREGLATSVKPARLGPDDVARVIDANPDLPLDAANVHAETEGLPFFVAEYLSAVASHPDRKVPADLRVGDLLEARLSGLTDASVQVLTTAAVIGRSFDLDVAREASGRSEEEVVGALEDLVRTGFIAETPDPRMGSVAYDFRHDKMRTFVYERTTLARRRLLHRRVAESLERRPHPDATLLATIANHLKLAGREQEAAERFKRAGDAARDLHANADALRLYDAALGLGHPAVVELHRSIGDIHTLQGGYGAALGSYERAAADCPPDLIADIEHRIGMVHHRRGDWELADSHLAAALEKLSEDGEAMASRILADRSLVAHSRKDADGATALAQEALELAERSGDVASLARAHNILGIVASRRDEIDVAVEHLEESYVLSERLVDPSARIAAANNLALALRRRGALDEALELTEGALELCKAQGDRHREAALHNNVADILHAAGREEESRERLKEAVAIFADIGEEAPMEPGIWKLVEW